MNPHELPRRGGVFLSTQEHEAVATVGVTAPLFSLPFLLVFFSAMQRSRNIVLIQLSMLAMRGRGCSVPLSNEVNSFGCAATEG
jgi:hypothetical protein